MLMGGNAIDSAIAMMYCNTVVNSQSMGIGGGFIMTVFLGNGSRLSMIARETAPAAAFKDMNHGDDDLTHYGALTSCEGMIDDDLSRSPRLWRPRLRGRHLGAQAEAGQLRRVLDAAHPAVSGHVL